MVNKRDAADHIPSVVAHMMTPGVVQIPGDVSVSEAALLLDREQTPCLLVKDTDTRFGIMTFSDIVKRVVAQGLEPNDVEVRAIMTRPVQFIEYDRAIEDASTLMLSTGVPLLIVTKQDQPVGILTARDLMLTPARCRTRIESTVRVGEGEAADHRAVITQLSHAGALLESSALLLPGTRVRLGFTLPGLPRKFSIQGTIVTSYDQLPVSPERSEERPGVDVQFTNLPPSDRSHIRTWVLQHCRKDTDPA